MIRRLILAILAAVMLTGIAVPAATASAVPAAAETRLPPIPDLPGFPTPDCGNAPVPVSPDRGFMGYLSARPDSPPPLDADVFAADSTATVYDAYGMAGGYPWHVYSTDCVPGPGKATARLLTDGANIIRGFVALNVGFVAMLTNMAYDPSWLSFLEAPTQYISTAMYEGIVTPLAGIIVAIVGIMLVARFASARLSAAVSLVAMVLVVFVVGAIAANYPTRISDTTDAITAGALTTVTNTIAGSESGDPASGVVSPVVDSVMYDWWVQGTLGDTESATAIKYGPILFDAQALTWAESQVVRDDPDGRGQEIIEAKQQQWKAAAAEIEASDKVAYSYLSGTTVPTDRMNAAIFSLLMLAALPFLLVSLCLVVMSFLIIRLIIMFLPLVALVTLLVGGSLRSLVDIGLAAVFNSVVFGIGAGINTFAIATLLAPATPIPGPAALLLCILVNIAMWTILSPYRKLTSMVKQHDPVRTGMSAMTDAERQMRGFATGAAKTAAGVVGAKVVAAKFLPRSAGGGVDPEPATATESDPVVQNRPEGLILDDPLRTPHKHYTYAEGGSGEVDLHGASDRAPEVYTGPRPSAAAEPDIVDGEVVDPYELPPAPMPALPSSVVPPTQNAPAVIPAAAPHRIDLDADDDEDYTGQSDRPEGQIISNQEPVRGDDGDDVFLITTLEGTVEDDGADLDDFNRQEIER